MQNSYEQSKQSVNFPEVAWMTPMHKVPAEKLETISKTLVCAVRRWKRDFPGLELKDLQQEAHLTLMMVTNEFKATLTRGKQFVRILAVCLRRTLDRRVIRHNSVVMVSCQDRSLARRHLRKVNELREKMPNASEYQLHCVAALKLRIKPKNLEKTLNFLEAVRRLPLCGDSMFMPMGTGEDGEALTYANTLASPGSRELALRL